MTLTNSEHLFPKIEKKGATKVDPNARTFLGSGGNLLLVPGCRRVDAVRVGQTGVPEFVDEEYPTGFDSNGVPKLEAHRVPLYQLVETEDGPALQRSVKSNDGLWQSGEVVVVVGVWGDAAGEAPSPTVPPQSTNIFEGEPGQSPSEMVGDRVAGRASATHMESPSGEPGPVPSELVGEPSPPASSPSGARTSPQGEGRAKP